MGKQLALDDTLDQFAERVNGLEAGDVVVRGVTYRTTEIGGDEAVVVQLVLSDPDDETWSVDDIDALLHDVGRIAEDIELPIRWAAALQPESDGGAEGNSTAAERE